MVRTNNGNLIKELRRPFWSHHPLPKVLHNTMLHNGLKWNSNARFTLSWRALVKTFGELWTRQGSTNVDIHTFVRELRVDVNRYNSWKSQQSKAYHWHKIDLWSERKYTHSSFNNEARHLSPLTRYDLPKCFQELYNEIRKGQERETRQMYLVSYRLDESVNSISVYFRKMKFRLVMRD